MAAYSWNTRGAQKEIGMRATAVVSAAYNDFFKSLTAAKQGGLDSSETLKVRSRAYQTLKPMTSREDLTLAEFDEGIELRLRSANKGDAVRQFLRDINPITPVAYLGDDVDDEDAFRVLNGRGFTVLVKPKSRFTAAQVWLRPPAELVGFLIDWKLACRGKL